MTPDSSANGIYVLVTTVFETPFFALSLFHNNLLYRLQSFDTTEQHWICAFWPTPASKNSAWYYRPSAVLTLPRFGSTRIFFRKYCYLIQIFLSLLTRIQTRARRSSYAHEFLRSHGSWLYWSFFPGLFHGETKTLCLGSSAAMAVAGGESQRSIFNHSSVDYCHFPHVVGNSRLLPNRAMFAFSSSYTSLLRRESASSLVLFGVRFSATSSCAILAYCSSDSTTSGRETPRLRVLEHHVAPHTFGSS